MAQASIELPLRRRNEPCCAPIQPPRLNPTQAAILAERTRAVGDTTRLPILDLLASQKEQICEFGDGWAMEGV